jgi:outer membrane protein TolC
VHPVLAIALVFAETRPIRLHDAIEIAVRQNPQLQAALADVAVAEGNVEAARGLDDLTLDAAGTWTEQRIPGSTFLPTEFDDLNGSIALTQPIPTGGKLQLKFSTDYQRTRILSFDTEGNPVQSPPTEVYTPQLTLGLTHSLLRGFGTDVARAQKRRARAQRDVALLNRDAAAANLLRDVESAYWDLAYAAEETAIRRQAAAAAREQLRVVEANIKVGKQPPSASAEVEVSIALREEDALFAEQQEVERAVELERLLNMDIGPDQPLLAAAERPQPQDGAGQLQATLAAAMAHNPALAAARAAGHAASIDVDVTDNGLLPQLDVNVGGGFVGSSPTASKAFSSLTDGYGLSAGLTFSQAIPRHAASGNYKAARATLHKAQLTQADISAQIAAAAVRLSEGIDVARRRLTVLARSTEAASLDLSAEKARFEVGRSTNFDVLRRQDELAQAQLRQARAKTDHEKTRAALDALTGAILARYGVSAFGIDHPAAGQPTRQGHQ